MLVVSIHVAARFEPNFPIDKPYLAINGAFGVQLFSIISGYTMMLTFGNSVNWQHIRNFYVRRFFPHRSTILARCPALLVDIRRLTWLFCAARRHMNGHAFNSCFPSLDLAQRYQLCCTRRLEYRYRDAVLLNISNLRVYVFSQAPSHFSVRASPTSRIGQFSTGAHQTNQWLDRKGLHYKTGFWWRAGRATY